MTGMHTMVNKIDELDDAFSQAEAVVPLQFHGARRGASAIEPVRRLMVAMLVDAIRCFKTKLGLASPPNARSLPKRGHGSSPTTIRDSSPSGLFVKRWRLIRKPFASGSYSGRRESLPAQSRDL
jgi:hypothetical protein